MADQQHPLTPPPELVQQWMIEAHDQPPGADARVIANLAAQWGANQELKACCSEINTWGAITSYGVAVANDLRAARRPTPPSLAEEALAAQQRMYCGMSNHGDWDVIYRALERLQELEGGND